MTAALSLATIQKVMSASDTYENTNSRLSLITSNLAQQKQLQNEIFEAAYRSRGAYSDMADTVAKLGITSGQQFGNTANIVKFTETMQKMFKLGGTPAANQSGALLQLQQAIGLGRLQGQDLRILAEDAPLVETAIAKYMGKSVGDIRKLGEQGEITSSVLINSILDYSSTVDKQMSKMPMTFGDVWNKLKTGAAQAFGNVFDRLSNTLNSPGTTAFLNGLIGGLVLAAQAATSLFGVIGSISQFFSQNWSIISPIIMGVVTALLLYNGTMLVANAISAIGTGITLVAAASKEIHTGASLLEAAATKTTTGAQIGLNAALLACPVTWIILLIVALIVVFYAAVAAVNHFTGTSISATGLIGGAVGVLVAAVYNYFVVIWNQIAAFVNFFGNVFHNPIAAVTVLFSDLAVNVLGYIQTMAQGIQDLLNKIPGVKVNITSGISNLKNGIAKASSEVKSEAGLKTYAKTLSYMQYSNAAQTGYQIGSGIEKKLNINNLFSGLGNLAKSLPGLDSSTKGTDSNPVTVKGTGSGGSVTVNIADQDLQYLRDLAEKDYVNKFSTAVLSPKLSFQYTGATGDQSDMKKIYTEMGKMMREELATAADGWYGNE